MTNRPVRVALLLLFLAAMGTTAYLFWIAEREARSTEAAARTFDDRARTAEAQVLDLRAAEQAYVATGQGPDFWFTRAAAALEALREQHHGPPRDRIFARERLLVRRRADDTPRFRSDGRPRAPLHKKPSAGGRIGPHFLERGRSHAQGW